MAKKDYQFLTTGLGAVVVGGLDQVLIDQARRGNLGSIGAADTQVLVASVAAIAGGAAHVLSKRQNTGTRLGDGALYSGLALLGQSTMHWADANYLMKTSTGTGTATSSTVPVNTGTDTATSSTTSSGSSATASNESTALSSANEDEG